MGAGFTIGRFAGIRISVNWSLLVAVALIVWTLADGIFPRTNPDLSSGMHVAMGIVATLLFFASILLHELGHALQARREGIEIDGITLWLFGGVALFRTEFRGAGSEFRVAIAGPVVTVLLACLFVLVALVPGLPEAVDGIVAWLGYINVSLLVFNMVPAFPLDGGRVLHSLLWRLKGELPATHAAAAVGRGFGFLLIAAGLASFVFGGGFSGAWLAFLGWFLLAAATAEARMATVRHGLAGLRVRDVMTRDPVTVRPDLTLGELIDEVVSQRRHTTYPVVEDGTAVGLLSFPRVARIPRAEWDTCRVADCMVPRADVTVLAEDEEAVAALAQLVGTDLGRGLVLSGNRLVGLVSVTDLARALDRTAPAP